MLLYSKEKAPIAIFYDETNSAGGGVLFIVVQLYYYILLQRVAAQRFPID